MMGLASVVSQCIMSIGALRQINQIFWKNLKCLNRLEICRDRWVRRSCKIFPNCVKFWGNNANSLRNYRVIYALNE